MHALHPLRAQPPGATLDRPMQETAFGMQFPPQPETEQISLISFKEYVYGLFSMSVRSIKALSATLLAAGIFSPLAAQANTSMNATQLSVVVAPISISGTRLGGFVDASGNGLTGGAPVSVTETGQLAAGSTMTAATGTTFNLSVTARAGDQVAAAGPMGTDLVPTTEFGSQTGRYSAATGTAGTLAIDGANAATITAGLRQGVTATAIFSTTMKSAENESQIRRIATSSNDQATFTAERQAARFQAGGSGLTAVTGGGLFAAAGLGADPEQAVLVGGTTQAGVAFTKTQEVRTGQAADVLAADSTDVTQPGYGVFTNTLGGTTAGAIAATNMNNLTVVAGGAGTSSTLSVIQSLSAF
jgi:hypothetical protein